MVIDIIKNDNKFYISLDGVIDNSLAITFDVLNSFMEYIYVMNIDELITALEYRFNYDNNTTHKDIYTYIMKNYLSQEELNQLNDFTRGEIDYSNEVIPKIEKNNKKQIIHKKALLEGVKFFFKNTKYNNGEVLFTGGTSLMLESEYVNHKEYSRFSLDIDFSFFGSKVEDGLLLGELMSTADHIINYLEDSGCNVHENANWKSIIFEYPGYGTAEIKIDWMPNYNAYINEFYIDNIKILKASNVDIIANKLLRLNERDVFDIKNIGKGVDISNLIYSLESKSKYKHGNEYAFINKDNVYSKWSKNAGIKLIEELLNYYKL